MGGSMRSGSGRSSGGRLPALALAPAKINLGLFVGPTRADGRHELVSVMQSISLADELTLEYAPEGAREDEVLCPGVDGPAAENLGARALAAFRRASGWEAPPLRLSIVKRIPVAAGLAGGSADAAAALRLAAYASGLGDDGGVLRPSAHTGGLGDAGRDLGGVAPGLGDAGQGLGDAAPGLGDAGRNLGDEAGLLELGAQLGADVPAQIAPGRWLATGAGELLDELPAPNTSFGVLVLPVAGELSTAAVYGRADRLGALRERTFLEDRRRALHAALDLGTPAPPVELLGNDLEAAARSLCPSIGQALAQAREGGADAAFVSGSGPTVIGLFLRANGLVRAQRAAAGLTDRTPPPICATPVTAEYGRAASVIGGDK
jgi:4-diphosphocytidyl-2-C-methyl-D-erythritol kinase